MASRIVVIERLLKHVDGCIAKHQIPNQETDRLQRWRRELLDEMHEIRRVQGPY